MTDRISIAELRDIIQGQRTAISYRAVELTGTPEGDAQILDALLEATEAAQALLAGPTRIENHPTAWTDLQKLCDALARFEFDAQEPNPDA